MDFENDVVHEKGKLGQMGVAKCVQEGHVFDHVNSLIRKARAKNIPIIFVKVGFSSDYKEWSPHTRMFRGTKENRMTELGTWGTEIHSAIEMKPEDAIIIKHRINPFYSTQLPVLLQSMEVDTLYLAGVSTNYVVQSAARDAHDRDFNVIIAEDCCTSFSPEDHANAIAALNMLALWDIIQLVMWLAE
jgi:nicotinamidase-related amidase